MKRKTAWLALPVLLCAWVWGVKWRADHPTPTKLDLELRALMLKSSTAGIDFYTGNLSNTYHAKLSRKELRQFTDCFYTSPKSNNLGQAIANVNGWTRIRCVFDNPKRNGVNGISIALSMSGRKGKVSFLPSNKVEHDLHPLTAKSWLQLLLNHPRIGPDLRRRVNP